MKKDETIKMLEDVRSRTTDPKMQKELDAKIKALQDNKTITK